MPHHPHGIVVAHSHVCVSEACARLIAAAARQHGVDLSRSWMIGDILDDVRPAAGAGCETVLIDNGETQWKTSRWRLPRYAKDFEAGRFVAEAMQAQEAAT